MFGLRTRAVVKTFAHTFEEIIEVSETAVLYRSKNMAIVDVIAGARPNFVKLPNTFCDAKALAEKSA